METNDSGKKIKGLDEFVSWVDSFCEDNHIPNIKYNEDDEAPMKLEYGEIISLSSEECFAQAMILMNYASYLQKKLDTLDSHLSWCDNAMNYLFSHEWDNYTGKFTPKEIVKKSIIKGNSYAQELEKCRIRLSSGVRLISEQCKDVKKRVSLLQDLGKKRSFS